jgi:hypothetical protein
VRANLLSIGDAVGSALWFAGGMFAAAFVCVVAYLDFQVTAGVYWSSIDLEYKLIYQRHYDTEMDDQEHPMRLRITAQLKATSVRTSLARVYLALLAWFALAWGAIRIMLSLYS